MEHQQQQQQQNAAAEETTTRSGGIKDFIAHTNMIGNVIAAAASQKNSYEPLPFPNYSLFDEDYDLKNLRINVNPHATTKYVFLPREKIQVKITAERKHGAHIFHPYVYTIVFSQAGKKWTVIRSYKEIKEAHKTLAKSVKTDMGRSCSDISIEDIKSDWPLFPTEHDHLIAASQIDERCKRLADYLERMLTYPPFRDHPCVLNLLGVCHLSFVLGLGPSILEGTLQKRSGDNVYYGHFSQLKICCDKVKILHDKRWFVLKDTYIVYTNTESNNTVGFVMLIDKMFEWKMKIKPGAYHAIVIKNLQRSLVLKCKSSQQQKEWNEKIQQMMLGPGRLFKEETVLINDSFAPSRRDQYAKWYVNAAMYMEHVMLALNNAKEEIFITDWWLCPELFLKRPTDDLQYRLDKILLKKASEGVKIYIMLFKEVSFAIGLLSSRAKNVLTQNGKNPNIKVLRHPEHSPAGVFLWSHHEKVVIIDQSIAFLGGIDLCFGRWDDDLHRLIDLGRKENKTDIDPNTIERTAIMNLASEIKKFSVEAELISEINQKRDVMERTDTEDQLKKEPTSPKEEKETAKSVGLELEELKKAQEKLEEPDAAQNIIQQQKKADALLVAALMGNSIMKFNKNRTTKLSSQQSAPIKLLNSQSVTADTPATSATAADAGGSSGGHHRLNKNILEKFKSLQPHSTSHGATSANASKQDELNSTDPNQHDRRSSNSLRNINYTAKYNKKNRTNTSSAENRSKSNLNSSKMSSNTQIIGAKASKLLVRLKTNLDHADVQSRNVKQVDFIKFDHLKPKKHDFSVPTDPNAETDEGETSKKEIVRKKWTQFKKSVKKKSQRNPLNRLRRKSSGSIDYDYEDTSSDDGDGTNDSVGYRVEESVLPPVISNEGYYWIGKDYSNTYKADFKDIADFSRDQFDRNEIPRMPWRDEALVVIGESARDLARHFIQRWNQCKREKVRQIESYPFLLPKTYSEPYDYDYSWFKDQLFKCEIQMTRSLDIWSGGICRTECSILNSYCDLIRQAEHYIYIENQFFVTTTEPYKDYDVKNSIGKELVDRIVRAYNEKKKFRVYIVLPLLPGFDNRNAIQAVQFYNLRSINLGEYSIHKSLRKAGINDPSEYITFHGMRNWSVLMGKLVQEIIYVHSKLMIVDDKYVICGSANINDRSMLGKRDSEVAAVVKDQEFFESTLNGQKVQVGKYANSLRKKIFKLHLGIYFNNPEKIEVQDCVVDEFYNYFRLTSHRNTVIYDEVFKCLPSDNILNFDDLTSYSERVSLSKTDPLKAKEELDKEVRGFIVNFPLKFLSQEKNFFPEINTPEGMVPTVMWT